jgi:AraC-like DNA-binding protein
MRGFASTIEGSATWSAGRSIPRHRHARAYAAVLLSGGYEESGSFERGIVADPDAIAGVAEKDAGAAVDALREQIEPLEPRPCDWPDLLARALRDNPQLRLRDWAERYGLAPATLSRGFGMVFATSPAAFRAEARAQSALALITCGIQTLAEIAAAAGFADQSHMTRAVSALTGRPPVYWRRSNWFKTPPSTSR